jgi:hypothetical protein
LYIITPILVLCYHVRIFHRSQRCHLVLLYRILFVNSKLFDISKKQNNSIIFTGDEDEENSDVEEIVVARKRQKSERPRRKKKDDDGIVILNLLINL